jgi:hypothetical protein
MRREEHIILLLYLKVPTLALLGNIKYVLLRGCDGASTCRQEPRDHGAGSVASVAHADCTDCKEGCGDGLF